MNRALVVVLMLCVSHPTLAQMPDTPAGNRLTGWLDAFNSDRQDALKSFVEQHVPAASRSRLLEASPQTFEFRARSGGFDFKKAEASTPTHLAALVQERGSDRIARIVIDVEPDSAHRVTSLAIGLVPRPPELATPRLSEQALVASLEEKLARDAAAGRFSGAVLVARQGRTVFEHAYGLADREKKVPNTIDTRFRIGSMNKMFTGVAVLQLAQAGKLRLDAPLGTYLTDYPNKDVAGKVTIHHLLTHGGGTGDIFGPQFEAKRRSLRTIQDYVKLYGARGLSFEPGSKWEYSNYGFLLLGAVIERVSGMSYYDYVASHVFAPAGMMSTASMPEDSIVPLRSKGYTRDPATSGLASNEATLPYRGTSAGGGYSTVRDLARFAAALREHKLLNATYTELLTTGKVDTPMGKYAYGFGDQDSDGVRLFGHGGGAPGMNGDLQIDPRSGYVTAVLANLDPPAAQLISDCITSRLPIAKPTP
ncbi:MAG: serine hydrolase domain-containing protein [Gemmatimonadaceae bacterium]